MASKKYRNWQTILYLDSCKEEWKATMELHKDIKFYVSPLHDKDIYLKEVIDEAGNIIHKMGDLKKPHHHITICFKNQVRIDTFNELCEELGALKFHSPSDNIVVDLTKSIEYHWHLNNPEKIQYDKKGEMYINTSEFIPHLGTMVINYINDNNCWSIRGIINKTMKDENTKVFDYVSKNTYFINQYLNEDVEKKKYQILQSVMTIMSVIEDDPDIIDTYALENEVNTLKEFIENET